MTKAREGETTLCEVCEEGTARIEIVNHEFKYGPPASAVTLKAQVPIWHCDTCEMEYRHEEGEAAMHDAVCRHLGRMTPQEVCAVRILSGTTQKDFAKEIGYGVASVKRWELGTAIPNRAASLALRAHREKLMAENKRAPTFRTEITQEMIRGEATFKLRGWMDEKQAA